MKKIRKLVIPVAGMGTRFLPVTKSVPKEMLPIVDVPTIQLLLEEAKNAGIEEVLFITSGTKNSIISHFDIDYELEDKLSKSGKTKQLEEIQKLPIKPPVQLSAVATIAPFCFNNLHIADDIVSSS